MDTDHNKMIMLNKNIVWENISNTLEFYRLKKFKYIETPWFVSDEFIKLTYDGLNKFWLKDFNSTLVGSAEQGFIAMYTSNMLEIEKTYISCTPCFRTEDIIDELHSYFFMKCECFIPTENISQDDQNIKLCALVDLAKENFKLLESKIYYEIVKTELGFDILGNSIEIGSYYQRTLEYKNKNYSYICGTAIAEPRFSFVQNTKNTIRKN